MYVNKTFAESSRVDDSDPNNIHRINPPSSKNHMIAFAVCLIYPLGYDGTQMVKQGAEYLQDPWNYIDMAHISLGYVNIYFQYFYGTIEFPSQVIFVIVLFICLVKTFFFMRIVQRFSYIVTMITMVVNDL